MGPPGPSSGGGGGGAAVVKDQVESEARALAGLASSVTPPGPPFTVAV